MHLVLSIIVKIKNQPLNLYINLGSEESFNSGAGVEIYAIC